MSNNTVFNIGSVNSASGLFLAEEQGLSIQRFDKPKHPNLLKLLNTGLGFFWLPEEISMAVDAANFNELAEADKHVVISNIKRQILLDSVMGRAPDMVFGPAVNDPVLEGLIKWWSMQEIIHSKSYTHIIQNSFPDPEAVLSGVMDIEEIVQCSNTVAYFYDKCIIDVQKFYDGEISRQEACKSLYLALHAANALESVRFAISFACSFAYAENGLLPGLGNIISLINRDELGHVAITNFLLKELPESDSDFLEAANDTEVMINVRHIWRQTYEEEKSWIDYLFSKGNILGLNATVLKQYLDYVTTTRLEATGVGTIEEVIGTSAVRNNPINWINNWLSNKNNQPAPQETELTNYEKGNVDMNIDLGSLNISL